MPTPSKLTNYSTTVDAYATIGKIQQMLGRNGASSISLQMDAAGNPTEMHFALLHNSQTLFFKLPVRADRTLARLIESGAEPRYRTQAHALRVAWRNVEDWIKAQVTFLQMDQAEVAEVFMPYAVLPSGRTLWEIIEEIGLPMLDDGKKG